MWPGMSIAPRNFRRHKGIPVRVTVTVLLFASYAEAFGARSVDLTLRADATAGDIMDALLRLPGARALPPAAIALNQSLATRTQRVHLGDEIAVIPPVAGG